MTHSVHTRLSSDRFGCWKKHRQRIARRGVPTGVCGKQAMDGLRRRVRHGRLPSRGACPGRDAAVSEARAQTIRLGAPLSSYGRRAKRSEEHTYELQSLMRISYAVFCLKKNK